MAPLAVTIAAEFPAELFRTDIDCLSYDSQSECPVEACIWTDRGDRGDGDQCRTDCLFYSTEEECPTYQTGGDCTWGDFGGEIGEVCYFNLYNLDPGGGK